MCEAQWYRSFSITTMVWVTGYCDTVCIRNEYNLSLLTSNFTYPLFFGKKTLNRQIGHKLQEWRTGRLHTSLSFFHKSRPIQIGLYLLRQCFNICNKRPNFVDICHLYLIYWRTEKKSFKKKYLAFFNFEVPSIILTTKVNILIPFTWKWDKPFRL